MLTLRESVFGIILVRIFPAFSRIRPEKTPYFDTFHAVLDNLILNALNTIRKYKKHPNTSCMYEFI